MNLEEYSYTSATQAFPSSIYSRDQIQEIADILLQIWTEPAFSGVQIEHLAKGSKPLPEHHPRLLGIFGKPQSGKDVIVEYLYQKYSGVSNMSYSDVIFEEVNDFFQDQPDDLQRYIHQGNKSHLSYRKLLQAWGLFRPVQDPQYWGNQVKNKIYKKWSSGTQLMIITGVRLPPDVELITLLGGQVWKVERPGNNYRAEHAVESALDELDRSQYIEIVNSVEGDFEQFYKQIESNLRM